MNRLLNTAWVALACAFSLGGCGGGGGGSSSASESITKSVGETTPILSMNFPTDSLVVTGVEGNEADAHLQAEVNFTGADEYWLSTNDSAGLMSGGDGSFSGSTFYLNFRLKGNLPAGSYDTQLTFHVCLDMECTRGEVAGSPITYNVKYTVLPNIHVQSSVNLSRQGQDPAPSAELPVTIPPEAGSVETTVTTSQPFAFDIKLNDGKLQVNTQQVRAGKYDATVRIASPTDPRYAREVAVHYQVDPPATGETDLDVSPRDTSLILDQGKTTTQRIKVTRPSWTSAWATPVLSGSSAFTGLKDLGNDEYEVTIDTRSIALGSYGGTVRFDAGPLAGTVDAYISLLVGQPASAGILFALFDANSPSSALTVSTPVTTADGMATTWTATSSTPWIHVLKSSGVSGQDDIQIQIDPSILDGSDSYPRGALTVSIDRPGTAPFQTQVNVENRIPRIKQALNGSVIGTKGRVYIHGLRFPYSPMDGVVWVSGATIVKESYLWDTRLLSDQRTMVLDLKDITPGQPIQVHINSTLSPSSTTIATGSAPNVPNGFLSLPGVMPRTPQFARDRNALYFAVPGTAYLWAHDGSNWALRQSRSIPGLIDIGLSSDGQRVFATTTSSVMELDPTSLAPIHTGSLGSAGTFFKGTFASNPWPGMSALAFSADGRAFASLIDDYPTAGARGIAWIGASDEDPLDANLTNNPDKRDPDQQTYDFGSNPSIDSGVIRSTDGQILIAVQPDGKTRIYRSATLSWADFYPGASGAHLTAISNNAFTYLQSDGVLYMAGNPMGASLATRIPSGYKAAGFGLSSNASYAYVYGYKIDYSGARPVATDAAVWVIDIGDVPRTPLEGAPIVATLPLPQPLGCVLPRPDSEPCSHSVMINSVIGDQGIFLSGPHGMVALQTTSAQLAQASKASIARAQSLSPRQSWTIKTRIAH